MAKREPGTCQTCKWLDAPLNKAGNRYFVPSGAYQCKFPVAMPVMPISVTQDRSWRFPPTRTWIFKDLWSKQCPTWEEWIK